MMKTELFQRRSPSQDPTLDMYSNYEIIDPDSISLRDLQVFLCRKDIDTVACWLSDSCFVCERRFLQNASEFYHTPHFVITLGYGKEKAAGCSDEDSSSSSVTIAREALAIHAATRDQALAGLEFIVSLRDEFFQVMTISQRPDGAHLAILGTDSLWNTQRNQQRKMEFHRVSFTPEQSAKLAQLSSVRLRMCRFLGDGGEAFVQEILCADGNTRLNEVRIEFSIPFNPQQWMNFLRTLRKQLSLQILALFRLSFTRAECQALAFADIDSLILHHCSLQDNGATLCQAWQSGRGPRGLTTTGYFARQPAPFGSSDAWLSVLNALSLANHVKRVSFLHLEQSVYPQLVEALQLNRGLEHLGLPKLLIGHGYWKRLLQVISQHPTLSSLRLPRLPESEGSRNSCTLDVVTMLQSNPHIAAISVHDDSYNARDWQRRVLPLLECNLYRKRFRPFQCHSERAAVLGHAVTSVADKPSPLYILLRQNEDIVASHLEDGSNYLREEETASM